MAIVQCLVCQKRIPAQQRVYLKPNEEPLLTAKDILLRDADRDEDDINKFFERYPVSCRTGCHSLLKRAARLKKDLRTCKNQTASDVGQFFDNERSSLESNSFPLPVL